MNLELTYQRYKNISTTKMREQLKDIYTTRKKIFLMQLNDFQNTKRHLMNFKTITPKLHHLSKISKNKKSFKTVKALYLLSLGAS